MKVASIKDVVEARAALREGGLSGTVHLHDACGRQTLSIELLEDASNEDLEQARALLAEFFAARRLPIEFNKSDDTIFYVV